MNYLPRHIESTLERYLQIFPAISLTGPRQSGKSTLLKEKYGDDYEYVSFDDPVLRDYFAEDPNGFMSRYGNRVIFDEIQKVPKLFNYLKIAIDADRQNYGNFIVTGSSQFSMVHQITETLAGRIGALSLLPFHRLELPEQWRKQQILKGSYPEFVHLHYENTREWFGAYINHYIERDVRNLAHVGNLSDFQRLIKLLAARVAQEVNLSSLASDLGVTAKTIQSWISILEASYIVFTVPCYHKNFGKRLIKRPKLYFYDTGLACYMTGLSNEDALRNGPMDGPIFENYVAAEIKKWIMHHGLEEQVYYFRSSTGLEVDLIIENITSKQIHLVEIKSTATAKPMMFQNMMKVKSLQEKDYGSDMDIKSILLYRGQTIEKSYNDGRCLNFAEMFQSAPEIF